MYSHLQHLLSLLLTCLGLLKCLHKLLSMLMLKLLHYLHLPPYNQYQKVLLFHPLMSVCLFELDHDL